MAYENGKQIQAPEQEEKQRPEEQQISEQGLFSMPNSMLMSMPVPLPGTPNSVMREMLSDQQIPAAEAEADRLSAGIRSGTPNSVRKEMGRRLGSDFSSVRFHTGPESVRRNEVMGARAYTKGNDVFFGRGGFDASVGAHELVHTVQQGAVSGHVSQSVSFGTVQMMPKWLERLKRHFKRSKDPSVLPRSQSEPPQDSAPAVPVVHGLNGSLLDNIRDNYLGTGPERSLSAPPAADSPLDHIIEDHDSAGPAVAAAAAEPKPLSPPPIPESEDEPEGPPPPIPDYDEEDEEEVPAALVKPSTGTTSTTGSSTALAAAAAAAAEPKPLSPPPIPESEDEPEGPPPPIPDYDEEDEEEVPAALVKPSTGPTSTTGSNPVSDKEEDDEIDVRRPPALLPDWTGEESDSEEEPVRLPRGGRYHRRSKGTGTVNEGVSWVNLGNNAVKVLKGVDDLSDYAAVGELRWGGRDTHTLSYDQGIEGAAAPYIEGGTSLAGAGTAAISTVTNAMDTVRHAKNIAAGESGADMVQKGLDTAASAGDVLASGAKFLGTVGAVTPVAEFVPGVNIAAGILRTGSGASQAIRGGIALHRIKKEIKGLQQRRYVRKNRADLDEDMDSAPLVLDADEREGTSSSADVEDEEDVAAGPEAGEHADPQEERENRLWQIFHQGKWISEYNRTAGSMKAGSGVLSATSGILTLTGAGAAVGAGLAAANAGLSVGSFAYDKIKKKHIRNRVIAQELGISEKAVEDDAALNTAVADTNTQQETEFGGSRKQIFAQINRRRARYLLDLAGRDKEPEGSDPDVTAADNVIRALGVHRKKDGGYADGAEELLAEKLGLG